jgi:hypothetical protein
MSEQLAIMRGVKIGMRDVGKPCLWFDAAGEGWGSLQILNWVEAEKLIEAADVYDFSQLEGKPCIVESDGPGSTTRFIRLARV